MSGHPAFTIKSPETNQEDMFGNDEIEKFIDSYLLKDIASEKAFMDYLSQEFADFIARFHKEKELRQIVYKNFVKKMILIDLDTSTDVQSILRFWNKVFEENNTHFWQEAGVLGIKQFNKLRYIF